MTARPTLQFISPWYLFPADSGGKLRTADILKYLNKLDFSVTLLSPAPTAEQPRGAALDAVCDRFIPWPSPQRRRHFNHTRMRHLFSRLPVPVATDRSPSARQVIHDALEERPAVVVVDFVHTHILMPRPVRHPSVLFTHNVEAEIFERQAKLAPDPVRRAVWRDQHRKMVRFEGDALACYDRIVTVSERDAESFCALHGLDRARVQDIPTGIDMKRYDCRIDPREVEPDAGHLVFTASMNSWANIDAVTWLMDEIWPRLQAKRKQIRLTVVGRAPPAEMVEKAKAKGLNWDFTGFVPSVEPFVHAADIFVIPLRIGGGTRIKVVEAIAMGAPIVSTDIGVEGIALTPGEHFSRANGPGEFAREIDALLSAPARRKAHAESAFAHVSRNFDAEGIAHRFQEICHAAIATARARVAAARLDP